LGSESSKLLINEPPLQVLPSLAKILDVNKSIILQQIQYWIVTSPHIIEGKRWIYNSYKEWSAQFPWLSPRAVRWHIRDLERDGYLIASEFNRDGRDNTKWYRINYDKLEAVSSTPRVVAKSDTPPVKERHLQVAKDDTPLPETTSEITTIDDNNGCLDTAKVFNAYEENIGMITPMVSENIKDALNLFPASWIIDAIKEAVKANVRKWKYIDGILKNWATNGRDVGPRRTRKDKDDPDYYKGQRYDHMVRRK
jgi:DnaD/phage-associated family protein